MVKKGILSCVMGFEGVIWDTQCLNGVARGDR